MQDPASCTPCKFDRACSRADCHFWHPNGKTSGGRGGGRFNPGFPAHAGSGRGAGLEQSHHQPFQWRTSSAPAGRGNGSPARGSPGSGYPGRGSPDSGRGAAKAKPVTLNGFSTGAALFGAGAEAVIFEEDAERGTWKVRCLCGLAHLLDLCF